ncbi:2-hydroxy-3-oxopropionate reductase [Sulfobacillus harzensis]|uniref:2-hydroxy-3-oxopropionate reductase n=1 Tax=Sulfobacillus harzensis TaxID=2729629 RepID=A0A7Y0L1P9_9FIRM|nr:2-hydroxy-3-oxopropionate reductase [Sulfobacillus harzensis]NMP21397.1 2-hydroxy-3-oxopropionate reductase [Sulfobacillus harzensis]
MTERIGFIGLGVMGKPMAMNLLKDGWTLYVHNRTRSRAEELAERGATIMDSPRQVAEASDIIITMVPDTPDAEAVYFGPDGVLTGARPGHLYIDMSTVTPAFARRLAEAAGRQGGDALDAPVSGGDVGAREGTLSIMVGGSEAAFSRAMPIFRTLGKNIVRMGEAGAGQITKACNQVVVALTIEAVAEGLTLAERAGIDPARVRQALAGGLADSRILGLHGQRMLEQRFQPGFRVRLHQKDLGIALDAADSVGLALPHTALAREHMKQLVRQGHGDLDHSALILSLTADTDASE